MESWTAYKSSRPIFLFYILVSIKRMDTYFCIWLQKEKGADQEKKLSNYQLPKNQLAVTFSTEKSSV